MLRLAELGTIFYIIDIPPNAGGCGAWLPEPLRTSGRTTTEQQASEIVVEESPENSSENKLEDDEDPAAQNEQAGELMITAE
ncbi:hypothetical protein J2R96_004972 [Bradyrhizobium elkanii]|nr:hypothetical protein [Bradyrhizobium elkanii]